MRVWFTLPRPFGGGIVAFNAAHVVSVEVNHLRDTLTVTTVGGRDLVFHVDGARAAFSELLDHVADVRLNYTKGGSDDDARSC